MILLAKRLLDSLTILPFPDTATCQITPSKQCQNRVCSFGVSHLIRGDQILLLYLFGSRFPSSDVSDFYFLFDLKSSPTLFYQFNVPILLTDFREIERRRVLGWCLALSMTLWAELNYFTCQTTYT